MEKSSEGSIDTIPVTIDLDSKILAEVDTLVEKGGKNETRSSIISKSVRVYLQSTLIKNTPDALTDIPVDIDAILEKMWLRQTPHQKKYELIHWILERPNIPFTIEDAQKSGAGYSVCCDNLLKIHKGKSLIPGFSLEHCNPGHYPIVYKLIPVTPLATQPSSS